MLAAETSGGLLIALPAANAEAFCAEIEAIDGAHLSLFGVGKLLRLLLQ